MIRNKKIFSPIQSSLMKKLTTEEFIRRAKDIHGDKYDYSKVVYKGVDTQVTIICPIHGEFQQTPYHHLNRKQGCRKCVNELTSERFSSTTNEFIKKAHEIHGDKYDYSKVVYKKAIMPVTIICPIHGEFQQTPHDHLRYHGCPKCAHIQKIKSLSSTTEEFIKKAREVHGDKYEYSKTNYINANTKVCIICPEHGEFWQIPNSHISGSGCPKCVGKEQITTEDFIKKAKEIHGDKYDYSKVVYKGVDTQVTIICPIHGEFQQTPYHHLNRKQGCPICNESQMEKNTAKFLDENNIEYIRQTRKKDLVWLERQSLDFYLPKYNIGIECQGRQHFQIVSHFGGESGLDKTIRRDKIKFDKCNKRGICLCYYITNEIDENIIIDNEFYGKIYKKNNIFKKIDYILTKIKEKNLVNPK